MSSTKDINAIMSTVIRNNKVEIDFLNEKFKILIIILINTY